MSDPALNFCLKITTHLSDGEPLRLLSKILSCWCCNLEVFGSLRHCAYNWRKD